MKGDEFPQEQRRWPSPSPPSQGIIIGHQLATHPVAIPAPLFGSRHPNALALPQPSREGRALSPANPSPAPGTFAWTFESPRAAAPCEAKRPKPSETARVQIGLHGLLGWPPARNSTFDEVAKILFPTFSSLLFIPKQTNK